VSGSVDDHDFDGFEGPPGQETTSRQWHYCLHNKAFMTYIRPMLEYSSGVWSPTQAGLIDKLESVQRHFTKRIPAIHELSYREIGLLP